MRIRTFILAASAAVAIGFFGVSYFVIGRILEHTVRENARESSATLAEVTFTGMYQVMSTGWRRKQAEKFISAISDASKDTPTHLQIYRGPIVAVDYGEIEQPPLDDALKAAFAGGKTSIETPDGGVRYLMPLVANDRCLRCHDAAREGNVLGVIEVKQDFGPLVAKARRDFLLWLAALAPLLMTIAIVAVVRVSRRLENAIGEVDRAVSRVNAVGDLRQLEFSKLDAGFTEFNELFGHLNELVGRLRVIAVDKHVLTFEIGLLEKFVITSEVVRDWGEYIGRLLQEINTVMPTHVLFSLFEVGDEIFDLEVFWAQPPSAETRAMVEEHARRLVLQDDRFSGLTQITLHHHMPSSFVGPELVLDAEAVALHTKTLMVERPKIGGIVGIGVNASAVDDDTLRLVMESILSTMLNVVGSVKAIHKYTRDMEYYATRDPLTDLYNRRVFWELFEYEVARSTRHGYNFALLVMDLDNFKLVNDGHGHAVGDRYLQAFAHAIRQALRPGDIFARYGGDEFVLLLPDISQDDAATVAQRVLESAYAVEIEAETGKITGSVSIGLALYPVHADNAKDLFLFADNMMYKAKGAGKHQVGIPDAEEVAEVFRDMTETTVQVVNAINEGRIVPFFQPIMDLQTNSVVAFEVLSRLALDGKHIEAGRFIEFAEKAGVIHRLDLMVMEKALQTLAATGFKGYLFVNLSPRALALSDFVHTLKRIVADCGVEPGQIVFEITERDTVKNIVILERLVGELKLHGFKLAIDDFGAGFSSFQYLRRFPVDFLKIEGDFIVKILENPKDRSFVQTIHQLAADLKIQVIAEHVESQEVLDELRSMGIELAQGYYVGRPEQELGGKLRWPLA